MSDALTVAGRVAALGQRLAGETPVPPGGGARFHFSQPGSVQGFRAGGDGARVENVGGRALRLTPGGGEAVFLTPTFVPPDMLRHEGYGLVASPALHPGQTVRATLLPGDVAGVEARLVVRAYGPGDTLRPVFGPPTRLTPGEHHLAWQVPDTGGWPVAEVGVALRGAGDGALLGRLSWDGAPDVTLARPPGEGESWRRAWVNAVDVWEARFPEAYRMSHNRGRGLLLQGAEAWRDYRAEATLTPVLAEAFGLVVRAGGLRRYYALLLRRGGALQLVKVLGEETVLAETSCPWSFGEARGFALEVRGAAVWAWLDGELLLEARDGEEPLPGGAVGLVCEEGTVTCEAVRVTPLRGDVSRPRGDPISRPPSP
ncbi:hypothetical protein [Deinococcus aetherius]|uniref:hypothetical protein n=1 Tax=Deinococcus aetherius TaxID=200252 RepID=UPI0031EB8774